MMRFGYAISPTAILTGVVLSASLTQAQPGRIRSNRIPLWKVDEPVCILAVNRADPGLTLPDPFLQPSLQNVLGPDATERDLRKAGSLGKTLVGPNVTFTVLYADDLNEGFNDPTLGTQRRAAFEYALGTWAARLQGPAEISVMATMTARGGSATSAVLASAGANLYWREFANAPFSGVFYPEALVEVISGSDPDPTNTEISVDYNSDVDNSTVLGSCDWYYGTDENPPGCDIDFVTVTIHEIAHGVGFTSSARSNGQFGIGTPRRPVIYDLFLVNGSGQRLIDLAPNSSNVTNPVFWNGTVGVWGHTNNFGGTGNAVIYAPSTFSGGSSISHLDEATYTGMWGLETPFYDGPLHTPDRVMFGVLEDIGWSRPSSRYSLDAADGFEDGSSANPFNTVGESVTDAPASGVVRLLPGVFPETIVIDNKAMTIESYGSALVGDGVGSAGAASDSGRESSPD